MLARLNTNAETQNLRWDSDFWVTRSPGQESRNTQGATGSLLYPCFAALLFCLHCANCWRRRGFVDFQSKQSRRWTKTTREIFVLKYKQKTTEG